MAKKFYRSNGEEVDAETTREHLKGTGVRLVVKPVKRKVMMFRVGDDPTFRPVRGIPPKGAVIEMHDSIVEVPVDYASEERPEQPLNMVERMKTNILSIQRSHFMPPTEFAKLQADALKARATKRARERVRATLNQNPSR